MKKKFTLLSLAFCTVLTLMQTSGNYVHSNAAGAPAGNTGSPTDGQTCARSGCHAGTAVAAPVQIISSNIPASGYVPGTQYTITASVSSSTGTNKFGFQISPQGAGGVLRGTPIITNTATTKIVLSKYITHTTGGNTGTGGTKTWSFDWIAPAAGSGAVTFYGAFNIANGTGTATGDIIQTNSLTVNEDLTVGLGDVTRQVNARLYPNPVKDNATLEFELESAGAATISILDGAGRKIQDDILLQGKPGPQSVRLNFPSDMPSGYYKLVLQAGNQQAIRNFMKN